MGTPTNFVKEPGKLAGGGTSIVKASCTFVSWPVRFASCRGNFVSLPTSFVGCYSRFVRLPMVFEHRSVFFEPILSKSIVYFDVFNPKPYSRYISPKVEILELTGFRLKKQGFSDLI